MSEIKELVKRTPFIGSFAKHLKRSPYYLRQLYRHVHFNGSSDFWERAYAKGGNSGFGSYGKLAEFKAEILNDFVQRYGIQTVAELGCGDGSQVALAKYPYYIGLDVSRHAVKKCRQRFADDDTRQFEVYQPYVDTELPRAELALSLDVIFHLVEDEVFDQYMHDLFTIAEQWVIIYASDTDENPYFRNPQLRHRCFSGWIKAHAPEWSLIQHIPNRYPRMMYGSDGSYSDFYIYQRTR